MEAAAHTPGGYGGVPQSVGKEFVRNDAWNESDHPRDESGKFTNGLSHADVYGYLANTEDSGGNVVKSAEKLANDQPELVETIKKELDNLGYSSDEINALAPKQKKETKNQSYYSSAPESNVDESYGPYEELSAKSIEPPHEVRDTKKLNDLVEKMKEHGWNGRPILAVDLGQGPEALTGSHRIAAAKIAGIDVPTVMVDPDIADYEDEDGKTIRDMMYEDADVMADFIRKFGDESAADLVDKEHKEQEKGYFRDSTRADSASFAVNDPTETDIARAIRDGKLESPQRLDHVWLFDLRVTGTGVAYRASLDEWVYRPPEFYLNDDFLERCQGVPVLFDHPEKGLTDTEEWRQRAIGALVLPYIPGHDDEFHATNEVWAIARIYDDDAAELMLTTHTSTSPAVEFSGKSDLHYTRTDDGDRLMIESKPTYLDHLAVCPEGVWDKMTTPRGVAQ